MELIKPRQISGDIMTLIEEADQKVIIITPYFKVKNWHKMLHSLHSIKTRNIDVEIYVRENEIESIKEVKSIGFNPITIPNLHTKLYLNEKIGIVSSMNILYSSDTNSLDIAVKTENDTEYKDLWDYYLRYIRKPIPVDLKVEAHFDWRNELKNRLTKSLSRDVYIKETPKKMQINTASRYEISIEKINVNELVITGILSGKEYEYAIIHPLKLNNTRMKLNVERGRNGNYDTVYGVLGNLKTTSISTTLDNESRVIVDCIVEFISAIEKLKKQSR